MPLGGPRTLGPVAKLAGASTGIGLCQDDGREAHVIVEYVQPDSLFNGMLAKGDEILEVNGTKVTHPKATAQLIVEAAPELTLLVRHIPCEPFVRRSETNS